MLRIISGEHRGRVIKTLEGTNTRPTTDRVKESLFNIIQSRLEDSTILDLFAGSGNLGLESLSRGSTYAVFVEKSLKALSVIKQNIDMLGYKNKSEVIAGDVVKAISALGTSNRSFHIIFIDPPYGKGLELSVLTAIENSNILAPNGIIVLEHLTFKPQPEEVGLLKRYDVRKYGNTSISFYRKDD